MINPPLHYYSIHRDAHPAVQSLPAQFYLDYLTNHVLKISERFSCNKISARAVEPVNGYRFFNIALVEDSYCLRKIGVVQHRCNANFITLSPFIALSFFP